MDAAYVKAALPQLHLAKQPPEQHWGEKGGGGAERGTFGLPPHVLLSAAPSSPLLGKQRHALAATEMAGWE